MKRNYKDDFDFIMRLYSAMVDSSGKEVEDSRRELGWPDYDWVATFYTSGYTSSKANAYVASCIGGECVNCYNDNGQIHIVVNNHHMGTGRLIVEFRAELPRDIYQDGYQRNVIPEPLDIELIVGKGDLPSEMEVELLLPYIKGDAFTYADFTPEQIADLKRPATEAAERLDSFVQTASKAETIRAANEKSRVSAEGTRVSQEQARVSAEETRVADETKRREAETKRSEAEEARKTAETERATEFASWEAEIDGKVDKGAVFEVSATGQAADSSDNAGFLGFECTVSPDASQIQKGDILRISLPDGSRLEVIVSELYYNRGIGNFNGFTTTSERPIFVELFTSHASATIDIYDIALSHQLSNIIGTPTEDVIEDIEPTLVTEALRKVPQTLTPEEQAQVKANLAISKMELFIDLWNEACGVWGCYNKTTGFFELNGLTDITYEEAVAIYYAGKLPEDGIWYSIYENQAIRTNLPRAGQSAWHEAVAGIIVMDAAFQSDVIEVINLGTQGTMKIGTAYLNSSRFYNTAYAAPICGTKIKRIIGSLGVSKFTNDISYLIRGCPLLEDINIYKLRTNFSFKDCPKISIESLEYMIQNRADVANKAITITVHPSVYSKLTDESNTEWHQVLLDAAAKNITFATT